MAIYCEESPKGMEMFAPPHTTVLLMDKATTTTKTLL